MECLVNRLVLQASVVVALFATVAARPMPAAERSETLLPETTKGYLSIPDWGRLESDFNSTQLGELANDELMRPFIEDLKRQIRQNGARRLEKLGVTFEELRAIVGGETALAMVQLDEQSAAQVALVDVTGHEAEAKKLLDRMADNLTRQGGRRLRKATDSSVAVFELPRREGERQARQTASFLKGSLLCIGSDVRVVENILRGTSVERKSSLASLPAFGESMARLEKARGESGKTPHVRWFIEPFGYAECVRILEPPKEKPNPDVLRVLRKQGFTAIRGLSGHVTFATERHELLHRTMILAPPVAADSESGDKYKLAARMLDFPNTDTLRAETWVPRDLATYATWNWEIQKAFAASKTLVDEWFGEPDEAIFDSVLADMRDAKDGPKVDIEKDLVGNLGHRVTLITDYATPVGPKSERWLAGVRTTDSKTVALALEKALKNEPNVRRREVGGFTVWEIAEQQQAHTEALVVEIPGGLVQHADLEVEEYEPVAFQPGKARQKRRTKRLQKQQQQQQQRVIQNMALTVAYDHLFVASHVDMLSRALKQAGAEKASSSEHLGTAADYRRVVEELEALGADSIAARFFSRSDEAFRINYELLRTNQMPKAQNIAGKLLNELLADGKPGTVRRARLDGSKLPAYDAVRRYLGPAGGFVVTEPEGWLVTGFMLEKETMVKKEE
jgi:hypothetical protein